jgi:zinc D-Ala-D-Ala carboxypeptidase
MCLGVQMPKCLGCDSIKGIALGLLFCLTLFVCRAQVEDKGYLLGKFKPETDSRFVALPATCADGSGRVFYLRKAACESLISMISAASRDGVKLFVISATRNFEDQKKIWERKWTGNTRVEGKDLTTVLDPVKRAEIILHYSSMPGSSRHHWGTDIDLNNLENAYWNKIEGVKTYRWLKTHAAEFGFCQPYTSKGNGRTGYEEEMWHWSYLPLSKPFLESYLKTVQASDLTGFDGSETATSVRIIKDYVSGVGCK